MGKKESGSEPGQGGKPRSPPARPKFRSEGRRGRSDSADAFIPDPEGGPALAPDDLAESLAEDYLRAATSGEDYSDERSDEVVPEEMGGPFVPSRPEDEMAAGTDESNPEDATVEPLPRANAHLVTRPRH